ncbi:hypothetical protein HN937_07020 [Candidatus Poribacteria bacterium]|jgi:hypothetical protein|nr:hypothetical protein [Candidatus Poribacteria bacterium]
MPDDTTIRDLQEQVGALTGTVTELADMMRSLSRRKPLPGAPSSAAFGPELLQHFMEDAREARRESREMMVALLQQRNSQGGGVADALELLEGMKGLMPDERSERLGEVIDMGKRALAVWAAKQAREGQSSGPTQGHGGSRQAQPAAGGHAPADQGADFEDDEG